MLLAHGFLTVDTQQEGTRKNSSWEEEGIIALCQLIGQWVTDSLGGGIDSRKEIDLWLLYIYMYIYESEYGSKSDSMKKAEKHNNPKRVYLSWCKVNVKSFSFSNLYQDFEMYTTLYTFYLLLLSQQASIAMRITLLISKSWWRFLKPKRLTFTLHNYKFTYLDYIVFLLSLYIYIYIYICIFLEHFFINTNFV